MKTKVKQIGFLVLAITLLFGSCSKKKKSSSWVINEVLVNNKTNLIDEYGQRNGWIEIYNNTAKTQDLGGMFLTTDKNNPKMYPIPLGDVKTQIKPYQHALFWADNKPFHGNFHTNFKLDTIGENYIALYDADGKTLIDEIVVPAGIPADKTFGYPVDGIKYDEEGNLTATILERVTPASNNAIIAENPKIVDLKKNDPWGIMITITSMLVVFAGLILLYLVFNFIGNLSKNITQKRVAKSGKLSAARSESQLSGEVLAAIAAAIAEMKEDQHDMESTILTIQQVKRHYSPWSSKIYTLRQLPRK